MIVKKIPARASDRRAGSGRAKHVRDLVDYMRSPDKKSPLKNYLVAYMARQGLHHGPERLIHIGARNFVCEDIDGQRAEMMAVAQAAVLSKNPIDHWLLSWREGEIPTNDEVDEAVAMFVDELGVSENQCIFAVHGDTHNRHVHIALNRYSPATGKVITIDKGFYRKAPHKAVARIVDRFGWQPEANARYVMEGGKPVLSAAAKAKEADAKQSLRMGATALEVRTGYRSAQRIAQEDALPLILKARTWNELHASLANRGIEYAPIGTNGAILSVAGEKVKASSVSRRATISKLEARLGQFEARESSVVIEKRPALADKFPGAFRADEFRGERTLWKSADKEERKRLGLKRPARDLETWLHSRNEPWFAERWRNRDLNFDECTAFAAIGRSKERPPSPVDGYHPYPCAEGVRYARQGEPTAFIDRGTSISVMPGGDEALLAALKLAIDRFDGKVRINGSDEVKQRTLTLAKQHGLAHHLTNSEFRMPELGAQERNGTPAQDGTSVTHAHRGSKKGLLNQAAEVHASRLRQTTDAVEHRSSGQNRPRETRETPVTNEPMHSKGGLLDQAAEVSASRRRQGPIDPVEHRPRDGKPTRDDRDAHVIDDSNAGSGNLLQQAAKVHSDKRERAGDGTLDPSADAAGKHPKRDRDLAVEALRQLSKGPGGPELPSVDPRTQGQGR